MADTKISDLTGAGTLTGTETVPVVQSGANRKTTTAAIGALQPAIADGRILGNNTGSSSTPVALTAAQVKTLLAIAAADVSGLGALATASTVGSAQITDGSIVNADVNAGAAIALTKLATMATARVLGNVSGSPAAPTELTAAQVKTFLAPTSADISDFTEAVQDALGALASGGAGLTMTYSDGSNTWQLDLNVDNSTVEISTDTLRIKDSGVTLAKMANVGANTIIGNNTGGSTTPLALTTAQVKAMLGVASTDVSDFTEAVQDVVGALGFGGSGLTATYNDVAGTLDLAVNVDGTTIEIATDTLQIKNGGVGLAKLASIATGTLLGNNTGSTAAPVAMNAAAAKTLLGITSTDVTDFTEATQDVVGALAAGGAGLTATYNDAGGTYDLAVNVDGSTVEISADALRVKDSGVTLAKITNIGAGTILGNNTGSSAAPIALTAAQTKTALAVTGADVANTPAGVITATTAQDAINQLRTGKQRAIWFDAKDFGAVGNGTTDDTVALQAAIDAASGVPGSTAGVGVAYIVLGPGVFKITSTLLIHRKAVTLVGTGIGNLTTYGTNPGSGTTLRWEGAAGSPMIRVTDSWWCDISGIFFWPGTTTVPSEGVLFESPITGTIGTNSRLRISRCRFGRVAWGADVGSFQYAVRIGGASNTNNDEFSLADCEFMRGDVAAVSVDNTQSVWGQITNCLFSNSAIGLQANSDITCSNVTFNHNTLDLKINSSNSVVITGWWSEHAVQHCQLTAAGGKLQVYGGKLLFDTEWTGGGALPSIDHQSLGSSACVSLNNLWFSNATGTTNTVKGRGSTSSTPGVFSVNDCTGLTGPAAYDFAAVSSPSTGGVVLKVDSRETQFMGRATGSNAITFTTNQLSVDANIDAGATRVVRTGRAATGSVPSASTSGDGATYYDQTLAALLVSSGSAWKTLTADGIATSLTATGLTGAANQVRIVGGTASGAPVSGTFAVRDVVFTTNGQMWICTVAGTPGTWAQVSGSGGGSGVDLTTAQSIAGVKTFTDSTAHTTSSTDVTPFNRTADVVLKNTSSTANNYMTIGHQAADATLASGLSFVTLDHTAHTGRVGVTTRTSGGVATRLTVDDSVTVATGTVFRAPIVANNQTGTAYTLVLTDAGKVVECNNASPITVTVPPSSSVSFPIGSIVPIYQQGAGQITVAAGAGVTIRTSSSSTSRAQYAELCLRKRGTDEWVLTGDLT